MKTFRKSIITAFLFSLFLLGMYFIQFNEHEIHAASTTNQYVLNLDYTESISRYGFSQPIETTKNGTTLEFGSFNARTLKAFIYGTSHNSNVETAESGHSFNFNDVTIALETDYSIPRKNVIESYSIRNINGSLIASSTTESKPTMLYSGQLADGAYYLNFVWSVEDYMTTQPNYTMSYGKFTCTYSFVIDGHAPTITGASTNKNEMYTKNSVTISAFDTGSGVKNLYMKSPSSSSFSACSNPITISNQSNGLYSFYATDNCGNTSEIHYIMVDTKPPVISIYNASGTKITETYTNKSFYADVHDDTIDFIECKKPNSNVWEAYTLKSVFSTSSNNGLYYFKATDKSGNVSEVKSICLDTIRPTGSIYGDGISFTNGSKINTNFIEYKCSDSSGIQIMYIKKPNQSSYVEYKGEKIYDEGSYSFYCIDNAGNQSSTSYATLDNNAPILSCEGATFYTTVFSDFSVKVTDSNAITFYYQTPSMSSFSKYTSKTFNVTKNDEEGRYRFYAQDNYGNTSEEYWVELVKPLPDATIVKSDKDNSVYVTWEENLNATLNGEVYKKGTWITKEGKYNLTISNEYKTKNFEFEIGHYYQVDSKKSASCTEEGFTIYKCLQCGDTYQKDYVVPTGHHYLETKTEPTCTEGGGIKHICTVCGMSYSSDDVEPLGHHFVETIKEPTCLESGGVLHSCVRCSESYWTDSIEATGHVYQSEILLPATCVEDGVRHHTCEKCGNEYSTFIPATDHYYEITNEETINKKIIRTYTCKKCGVSYTQDLGNQYEKVSSYIEFLFIQYRSYMMWIFLATSGIWSIAIGIAIIVAHRNEDKAKAKKMLINYAIGLVIIFIILVACPYLIKGISNLISK